MKLRKQLPHWLIVVALSSQALPTPAKDWSEQVGATATESRSLWQQTTQGEELAQGKDVQFFPKPNYRLTTDDNDAFDLTDGELSKREDDRIWFNKDAVGWLQTDGGIADIALVLDLGAEQNVGKITIRLLGGREQGALELPAGVEFLGSTDGQTYHSLQRMIKLMPAESDLSDFKTTYYLPEEGRAYMHPFSCPEAVRARYIAVRITPHTGVFTDQISVLKAGANQPLKELSLFPAVRLYTDGVVVSAKAEPFTVTTNVITPNWFNVRDYSGLNLRDSEIGFRLEIPSSLTLLPGSATACKFSEITSEKPDIRTYLFTKLESNGGALVPIQGPLYFKSDGTPLPKGATATFIGQLRGKDSHAMSYPLQLLDIPSAPRLGNFDVGIGWILDKEQRDWPGVLDNFEKLGFTSVSTFPRYFSKDGEQWSKSTRDILDLLAQSRQLGFKVLYNESPFHVMETTIKQAEKAGKLSPAEIAEIFNQPDGQRGKWINPLYRGLYFQAEIDRVAGLTRTVQPDLIYHDIEWWSACVQEAKRDPRAIAAWKASGKSWEEFITDVGADVLLRLKKATDQATAGRKTTVGIYGGDPVRPPIQDFFQWGKIYPQSIDIAMPSIYVQGRAWDVAERVRADYDAIGKSKTVPWLTAGTYGEFAPQLMEPMILETILNGAKGFTYYRFLDIDPLDYYFHAKALSTLGRFETLLRAGKPVPYKGDNPNLHYTCFASENEALLLVGNYHRSRHTQTVLSPVFKTKATMVSLGEQEVDITNKKTTLDVPVGEFRLIHVKRAR